MHRTALVCGLVAASVPSAHAATINVPADFQDVPDAVAAAQAGDEIVIAPGEYDICPGVNFPADDIVVRGLSGNPEDVILLGGGSSPIVVNQRLGVEFRSVTITDCATAIAVSRGELRLENCLVIDNAEPGSNGTIVGLDSDIEIDRCVIADNLFTDSGSASAVTVFGGTLDVAETTFARNTGATGLFQPDKFGAALLAGIIINPGSQFEGAIVSVRDSVFADNVSDFGAAAAAFGSTLEIDRCLFTGNDASLGGAVLSGTSNTPNGPIGSDTTIENSIFNANHARRNNMINGSGGAAAAETPGALDLVGCTLHANTAETSAPGVYAFGAVADLRVANCLITDHASPALVLGPNGVAASNLETTAAAAGLADPLGPDGLPATLDEDFDLLAGSPAIDAGDNAQVGPTSLLDFDGDARFADDPDTPDTGVGAAPFVDIGAHEFDAGGPCSPADLAAPLGVLDLADINAFVTAFTAQDPAGDLDGNSVFDLDDITAFVAAFLAGCP